MNKAPKHTAKALMLLMILGVMGLTGCSQSPTEDIIKEHIESLESHIEDKKTSAALAFFHDSFTTTKGYDREWVKRTLLFHQVRHQNIEIVVSKVSVSIKDEYTVLADLHALATGGQGLLPVEGAVYAVHTEWRLQDGDWQLIHADWEKSLTR